MLLPAFRPLVSPLKTIHSAIGSHECYVFIYNPHASPVTIHYTTRTSSGSFSVGAGASYQWQVPQNSGARLVNTNGMSFFALSTVGARPTANNVHDWGFTLVPEDGLTAVAVVGWGPGSSDLTQNGSPVWVAPAAATRIYVDFNGDYSGPLTDPKGNNYDVHYDLEALESRTIYDPDKDQTAMRLYTLNGTLFATAWGQDPAVAGAGNPYLDLGTTVLPFPVPVLRKSCRIVTDNGTPGLSIGDLLEYRIEVDNKGLLPLGNMLLLDGLPVALEYQTNTTTHDSMPIPDDGIGGTPFPLDETGCTIPFILRGGTSVFTYRVEIKASGSIRNTAATSGLEADHEIIVPPPAGADQCSVDFTDNNGTPTTAYPAGGNIYVRLTDKDANLSTSAVDTVTVLVKNETHGDVESLLLTESGSNTNRFFSLTPLPSSPTAGLAPGDGVLYAVPGHALSVTYIDPLYGDFCEAFVVIAAPSAIKPLYLTTDGTDGDTNGSLDRINPVAAGDTTTRQTAVLEGGPKVITNFSTTSSFGDNTNRLVFSHTVTNAATDRLLLVSVAVGNTGQTGVPPTVTNVSWNAQNLTLVGTEISGGTGGGARMFARTSIACSIRRRERVMW